MSKTLSAKNLLIEHNDKLYREFTLNDVQVLSLPAVSSVPWVGAGKRHDLFEKNISHPGQPSHVKFITKNKHPHTFLWQSTAKKIKQATRWGIVRTHSVTGKTIAALGQYRVLAHERVAKGMISDRQSVKLKLLDVFQDRFEALQELESLVNKNITIQDYAKTLQEYVRKLEAIRNDLIQKFIINNTLILSETSLENMFNGIETAIEKTKQYYDKLYNQVNDLSPYRNARGNDSILEFVKQQMIQGLYELQGINQDLTFDGKRSFAFGRGELNSYIEDAKKIIDDHQADLCNTVTQKHHGLYAENENELITYDFSEDSLSPERERQTLLALSFIEGWDKIVDNHGRAYVCNENGDDEVLEVISATRWRTHRDLIALFKSLFFYAVNIFKSVFVYTQPWEEESWGNPEFHLTAAKLRKESKPNEPLWRKPFRFFSHIFYAFKDMANGVRDFGANLTVRMPVDIINDWESSKNLPSLDETLKELSGDLTHIHNEEAEVLQELFKRCDYVSPRWDCHPASKLARVEYELTPGEQNDILTSIARGLNGFESIFTHNFSKDPMAGLIFTSSYVAGALAIYAPEFAKSLFGSQYVDSFTKFAYSMGSSPLGAAIAGSSSQAQCAASTWDSIINGPTGSAASGMYQFGEDPLTLTSYAGMAYGLGYVLVNGIGGHKIPVLSDRLKEDLGSVPEAGYPAIGIKFFALAYEGFVNEPHHHEPLHLTATVEDRGDFTVKLDEQKQRTLDRFRLALWIANHSHELAKLDRKKLFILSQQIEHLFTEEESRSLHKLLYPESHFSIAFQIFSLPLSYIPALLRVFSSLGLSTFAYFQGNNKPFEPVKRAGSDLFNKIAKDLSRLLVFASYMLYLPYLLVSSVIKVIANVSTMLVSRILGFFGWDVAHRIHQGFSSVHLFFRNITEYVYPSNLLKAVEVAHPNHTMKEVEASYLKLIKKMGVGEDTKPVPRIAVDSSPLKGEFYKSLKLVDRSPGISTTPMASI